MSCDSDRRSSHVPGGVLIKERKAYENNQQDVIYRLIYYSKSALHVSGDVFAHHQEHLTVFTSSGSVKAVGGEA